MTTTGRKVIAIYGDALLDDVRGIEAEALADERARIAEAVRGLEGFGHDDVIFRWRVLALVEPTDGTSTRL